MQVESHHKLGQLHKQRASRVLIRLEDGTPIMLCVEFQPNHVRCFRAGDEDFNYQLQLHGVNDTVLVTKFDPAPENAPKGKKSVLRG